MLKMNRHSKRSLAVVAVLGTLAICAASFGIASRAIASPSQQPSPFNLLRAAQTGPTSTLNATDLAILKGFALSAPGGSDAAEQNLSAAYALASDIGGHAAYLIPSQTGGLCFFVDADAESCGPPLTSVQPVRIGVMDRDSQDASGPMVFGLAADGIRSVSFTLGGTTRTVAVHNNVLEFDASSSVTADDVTNVTATFADGQTSLIG